MGQSEPFTRALIPLPDLLLGLTWFANARVFLGALGFGTRCKKDLDWSSWGSPARKKLFIRALIERQESAKYEFMKPGFISPSFAKLDKQCLGTHLIFPSITNIQVKHWKYCLDACFVWIDLDNLLSFCFLTHFHFTCWVCQTRSSEMVQIVCILHIEHKLGIFGP